MLVAMTAETHQIWHFVLSVGKRFHLSFYTRGLVVSMCTHCFPDATRTYFVSLILSCTCRRNLCDGRGHLIDHLLNFPTHTKLYSHKLQKLVSENLPPNLCSPIVRSKKGLIEKQVRDWGLVYHYPCQSIALSDQ